MPYVINDECIACDGKYVIDGDTCISCGACAGTCPVGAPVEG